MSISEGHGQFGRIWAVHVCVCYGLRSQRRSRPTRFLVVRVPPVQAKHQRPLVSTQPQPLTPAPSHAAYRSAHRAHPPFVVCSPRCAPPDHAQQMDSYINLTPVSPTAIAMGQSPARNQHNQQQQQQQQQILLPEQVCPHMRCQRSGSVGLITHRQEIQRQVEEYKRSVTIIIWYKVSRGPPGRAAPLWSVSLPSILIRPSHCTLLAPVMGLTPGSCANPFIGFPP